jgi:hypothetical protein
MISYDKWKMLNESFGGAMTLGMKTVPAIGGVVGAQNIEEENAETGDGEVVEPASVKDVPMKKKKMKKESFNFQKKGPDMGDEEEEEGDDDLPPEMGDEDSDEEGDEPDADDMGGLPDGDEDDMDSEEGDEEGDMPPALGGDDMGDEEGDMPPALGGDMTAMGGADMGGEDEMGMGGDECCPCQPGQKPIMKKLGMGAPMGGDMGAGLPPMESVQAEETIEEGYKKKMEAMASKYKKKMAAIGGEPMKKKMSADDEDYDGTGHMSKKCSSGMMKKKMASCDKPMKKKMVAPASNGKDAKAIKKHMAADVQKSATKKMHEDWFASVKGMLSSDPNEVHWDGISKNQLAPKPKAGEVGFAPQGKVGQE